jgi:hypothetical protein
MNPKPLTVAKENGWRMKSGIREIHFEEVKKVGNNNIRHNLNDIRFWDDPVWN